MMAGAPASVVPRDALLQALLSSMPFQVTATMTVVVFVVGGGVVVIMMMIAEAAVAMLVVMMVVAFVYFTS
jgi:hypothetical protein